MLAMDVVVLKGMLPVLLVLLLVSSEKLDLRHMSTDKIAVMLLME